MKIRKNDTVAVIAGKDKGKTGKVLSVLPREGRVVVEGVNVAKRHQRATNRGEKGQILEKTLPIHISNVQLIDPKTNKPTRVGIKEKSDGTKARVAKKSGQEIA